MVSRSNQETKRGKEKFEIDFFNDHELAQKVSEQVKYVPIGLREEDKVMQMCEK